MVTQMVAVGEETGALDDMLTKVSDYYDREVEYAIKNPINDPRAGPPVLACRCNTVSCARDVSSYMGHDTRYEKIRFAFLKRRFYLGLFVLLPPIFSVFALAAPLIFS